MKVLQRLGIVPIALAIACATAQAEDYPTRPVRVIVGFPAGSSADITARIVGQRMGRSSVSNW